MRDRWLAAVVVVVLALAGGLAALTWNAPGDDRTSSPGTADAAQADGVTQEARGGASAEDDGSAASESPLAETPDSATARMRAVSVSDSPQAPANGVPDDDRERYLEQTRAIVEADPAALRAAADQIVAALGTGDADALGDHIAQDEGPQTEFLDYIANRYPTILASTPADSVNIFSAGDATIYMAYAVVTWEDAGITSEHTIPIPMRFVDDQWYLTSVEHWSDPLQFVQSVPL